MFVFVLGRLGKCVFVFVLGRLGKCVFVFVLGRLGKCVCLCLCVIFSMSKFYMYESVCFGGPVVRNAR